LLEKLFTHQFLRDASEDQLSLLQPEDAEDYALNGAFTAAFQSPAAAVASFERFCEQRFLLLGGSAGLSALVRASCRGGVRQMSALVTPGEDDSSRSCQGELDAVVGENGSEQTVRLLSSACWDDEAELRSIIQGCDAVVHLAARPMIARARLLNRLCVEERKAFIQAVPLGDQVWLGPLVGAELEGCWECAWRRWQANQEGFSEPQEDYAFRDQPGTPGSCFLAQPELTMLAQWLIFGLFRHFTRTGSPDSERHLSILDLATGLSETHAFLPHPHCQACQFPPAPTAIHFLEHIQQLQRQSPIEPADLLERLRAGVVDARLGLFTFLEDADVVQMPLAIAKATLSNPMPRHCNPEKLTLAEAGINIDEARWRAAQKACTSYAAHLVDCRRLLSSEEIHHLSAPLISAEQVRGGQASLDQRGLWTWAWDIQARQARLVPARSVFSPLSQPGQGFEDERGVAAGLSWDEAVCQALLDWCNYLTVEELKNARRPYMRVDLTDSLLTPEGAHLHLLLKIAAGEEIAAYDITGQLRVPTFVLCRGEKVVACSSHWNQAQALTMGFTQALLPYQVEPSRPCSGEMVSTSDFPAALRGTDRSVPHYILPETWQERQTWTLKSLQASDLRALAVPLDHDPALARVLPFVVRILLCHAEPKKGE
jgi:bacteriocin biosynthesis cyclodehydratase domain-containing protein